MKHIIRVGYEEPLENSDPDFLIGPFDTHEDAWAFLEKHDEKLASIEEDFTSKDPHKIVVTVISMMNTPEDLNW